jgi:hypothetical protein
MGHIVSSILPIAGAVVGSIVPGVGTAAGALIGGTIGGAISGSKNTSQQNNITNQQLYQSGTIFGEQQGFEKQLQQLIANPSSVTSLPGYQFNFNQGNQSVARQFGNQAGSGAEGVALTEFGQNFATSAYTTQVNLLMQLAGLGSPVNPTQGLAGASASNSASFNQMGSLLASLGFASQLDKGLYSWGGSSSLPYEPVGFGTSSGGDLTVGGDLAGTGRYTIQVPGR